MDTIDKSTGQQLVQYAREVIAHRFDDRIIPELKKESLVQKYCGVFVTLKIDGALRGCIGNIEPVKTLGQGVHDNAINAAFHDTRFAPLASQELDKIRLSVSVLTVPVQLKTGSPEELLEALSPEDGVILKNGRASATFLPQVWQQLPKGEAFLGQLCSKAGLNKDCWRNKDTEIWTYRVQNFTEDDA